MDLANFAVEVIGETGREDRGPMRGLLGTTATNVATAALGVVSSVLAARLLGPGGRGELAAILNWPLILTAFGSLGVTTATGYYCGRQPSDAGKTIATAWVVLAVLSFPAMAAGYLLMPWLLQAQPVSAVEAARFMLLLVLVQLIGGLPYWALQGLGRFTVWNGMRVQMPILWVIVLLVSRYTSHRSPSFVASGYLLAMTFHDLTWMIALFRSVRGPYRPDAGRLAGLLRYGLPSVFATVPQHLSQRLDQLLMAALLPSRMLGLYVVAVAWSGALSPILTSVAQVVFPLLAAVHDREAQVESLQRIIRFSLLCAVALTALLLLATPLGLPFVFGAAFAAAVPTALLLVMAAGVASVSRVVGEALRGMGLPKWVMAAEFVGMAFGVSILTILLPRYQLVGAAVASLAGSLATFITYLRLISGQTGMMLGALVVPRGSDWRFLWGSLVAFRGLPSGSKMEIRGGR